MTSQIPVYILVAVLAPRIKSHPSIVKETVADGFSVMFGGPPPSDQSNYLCLLSSARLA